MAVRIVTDSASDILEHEAKAWGVTVIPLTLTGDGKEYKDGLDMDPLAFFSRLESVDSIPTTSQVTPVSYEEVYEELTKNGDEVVVITLASTLSGTCQSANIAAADYEDKVFVVDSLNATVGEKLLVERAVSYVAQGLSAKEVADRLVNDRGHIKLYAKLNTLEYLKKGGRISAAVALAGGLLSIKPVIEVREGVIELIAKARGAKNANVNLAKFIKEAGGIDFNRPFSLVYSGKNDDLLQEFVKSCPDVWEGHEDLNKMPIGAVIGTHIGPGACGLAFFEKGEY